MTRIIHRWTEEHRQSWQANAAHTDGINDAIQILPSVSRLYSSERSSKAYDEGYAFGMTYDDDVHIEHCRIIAGGN